MQTIKTGVVIVLLIAVCYGAFVALNAPEADIPKELQVWANSEEFEGLMDIEMPADGSEIGFDLGSAAEPLVAGDLTTMSESPGTQGADSLPSFPSMETPGASSANTNATQTTETPLFPDVPSLVDGSETDLALQAVNPFPGDVAASPASLGLDGPAVPFNTAETSLADSPNTELVSRRIENKNSTNDWPATENLPLLSDTPNDGLVGGAGASPSTLPTMPFSIAREQALQKASAGSLREALEMLSPYYDSPELGHTEHSDLVDILDALSREAIYSNRHLIEPAYHVAVNDTVASVAARQQISPELLTAINGMGNAKALVAGSRLKVVQGPFRARVSLNRGELTLFLGDMYAGRFPISIGTDNPPTEGVYFIEDRRRDRTYYGTGDRVIKGGDPENPYGGFWLSMGNDLSIHGSPEMARSDLKQAGCISLAPLDAADVYNILTKQSRVEIRR